MLCVHSDAVKASVGEEGRHGDDIILIVLSNTLHPFAAEAAAAAAERQKQQRRKKTMSREMWGSRRCWGSSGSRVWKSICACERLVGLFRCRFCHRLTRFYPTPHPSRPSSWLIFCVHESRLHGHTATSDDEEGGLTTAETHLRYLHLSRSPTVFTTLITTSASPAAPLHAPVAAALGPFCLRYM